MRMVTIKGTEEQLVTAKQLLQAKVEEEEAMRRKIDLSASNRAPRHKHKPADDGKDKVRRLTRRSWGLAGVSLMLLMLYMVV